MALKKYPYYSSFSSILKPLVSSEKDKFLATASLAEVSKFLPNVDIENNVDLLPVSFNACVVNRVNKNGDVIDTNTALATYKNFINKYTDVEHNRQKIVGVILTSNFSEFGTDKLLTEEQVKTMTSPFNITLGAIVWRLANPDLAELIEESNDETSDKYMKISASWELGFTDFKVAVLEGGQRNLEDATILDSKKDIDNVKDYLKAFGGDGKNDDKFYYRMPSESVLPLGIGFTETPAAEVKGVAVPKDDSEYQDSEKDKTLNPTAPEPFDSPNFKKKEPKIPRAPMTETTINAPDKPTFPAQATDGQQKISNNISQSNNLDVKIDRIKFMKITSIQDITDENLKTATAATIADFISSELKKGNDTYLEEKNRLNNQISKATEDNQKLKADYDKTSKELATLQATVSTLTAEKEAREAAEKFNARMNKISEVFELDDDVRAALVEEVKAIASDEDFTKWEKKASILLKGYAKKMKKGDDDDDADDAKAKAKKKESGTDEEAGAQLNSDDSEDKMKSKKKSAKASEEAEQAVASALDNADKEKGGLPNAAATKTSLAEKYKTAFAVDQFVIK